LPLDLETLAVAAGIASYITTEPKYGDTEVPVFLLPKGHSS
jgi:hypothetical protein